MLPKFQTQRKLKKLHRVISKQEFFLVEIILPEDTKT